MKLGTNRRAGRISRHTAPAAALAVVVVCAASVNASATSHDAPSYPSSLSQFLSDIAFYGDPTTAAQDQAYMDQRNNKTVVQQVGRAFVPRLEKTRTVWDASGLAFSHVKVTPAGAPHIGDNVVLYHGSARLANATNREKSLSTQAFGQDVEDSISTSLSKTFGITNKLTTQVKMGPFFSGGDEFETSWTLGRTDTTTTTVTNHYTAPSQTMMVPPHTVDTVTFDLYRNTYQGKVNITGDLDGSFEKKIMTEMYTDDGKAFLGSHTAIEHHYSVYDTALAAVPLTPGFYLSGHHTVVVPSMGMGEYTADVANTNFDVTVSESPLPTTDASPRTPVPASALKSYSYTVPAQITRAK
ncbi:ETX/MTX2 family pore-forming toxin [Streptomyces sp. HUAS TT7]|uniref:ETX/MTX2 family pore-forming toxin n=1 Tax=Streptomyces sp. HUAS TT7 TaxID=3447507 RepID=UPI003F657847